MRKKRDATVDAMYKRLFGKAFPKSYTKTILDKTIPTVGKDGQLRPRRRKQ